MVWKSILHKGIIELLMFEVWVKIGFWAGKQQVKKFSIAVLKKKLSPVFEDQF